MSYFGDGTFKQSVLEEIEYRAKDNGMSKPDAASEVAEVLAYLCQSAFNRDEEMERVRVAAVSEARREMLAQLAQMAHVSKAK